MRIQSESPHGRPSLAGVGEERAKWVLAAHERNELQASVTDLAGEYRHVADLGHERRRVAGLTQTDSCAGTPRSDDGVARAAREPAHGVFEEHRLEVARGTPAGGDAKAARRDPDPRGNEQLQFGRRRGQARIDPQVRFEHPVSAEARPVAELGRERDGPRHVSDARGGGCDRDRGEQRAPEQPVKRGGRQRHARSDDRSPEQAAHRARSTHRGTSSDDPSLQQNPFSPGQHPRNPASAKPGLAQSEGELDPRNR